MGIKLQDLIKREILDYGAIMGKIIAVDAPNIIMGLFKFARKNTDGTYGDLILDRTQRPISHLYGLLYRINFYYSRKIFPIFCYDGRDSELKKLITKDQLKDFRFTQKWYGESIRNGNKKLARQIALSKEYMWQNIIIESKQLLGALGVPYVESPASAESQCSHLVQQKIAHYSNSQDFDSLLFGCPHLIQNLSKSLRRKVQGKWKYTKITPLTINLHKNLSRLNINQFQLVDLGFLVGTDYFSGIKGLGPKKSLVLIKKYNTIEQIISTQKEIYDFRELTTDVIRRVRKIFLFPEVNNKIDEFYWNFPHKQEILNLMCENHHLNRERVDKNINRLISNYHKCRTYFHKVKNNPKKVQLTLDI
jgi:flap endonuclease-1